MPDFFPEKESGQAVMLVFETIIGKSQLLDIKHLLKLEPEHYSSDSDPIDPNTAGKNDH